MKTAYVSKRGIRILIETFPNPDGGITINNYLCSNDGFRVSSDNAVEASSDATEEQYHLTIRGEIEKRGGTVITRYSSTIN
jgi:hypothetical protein